MAGFRRKQTEAQEEWIIPLTERNDGENKQSWQKEKLEPGA